MDESNRTAWQTMAMRVNQRMQLLDNALEESGLRGEDFAAAVAPLFDKSAEEPALDYMTADELAHFARIQANLSPSQPDRMVWPNCNVVVDTQFTTTKEWELIRSMGLGGSEAAVVLGVSPYQTKLGLYHLKVGTPKNQVLADEGKGFIFAYGHLLEGLVISTFCQRSGAELIPETRMFSHEKYPWITANVDGIIRMPADAAHPDGRIFVFEAKTTTQYNKDHWKDNLVPVHYPPQCRQYMAVLNDPRICGTYIGCIYGNTPNDFIAKPIMRDLPMEDAQIEAEDKFWTQYVLAHRPPKAGENAKLDSDLIRELAGPGQKKSEVMPLGPEYLDNLKQAKEISAEISATKKRLDQLTEIKDNLMTPIKAAMGTNSKASVQDASGTVYTISWTPVSRTKTDMEKLKLSFPEVYNQVVTVTPESYRTFSIKEKKAI
jgi:putative phage-type endonuclease